MDRLRACVFNCLNRHHNYPTPAGPGVTIENLRLGNVGLALSVLYYPFADFDLENSWDEPPSPDCFQHLEIQIQAVEDDIRKHHSGGAMVVHNHKELQLALTEKKVALIHAVEGAVHLGRTVQQVKETVQILANHGVAYVTVAHLFWKRVATNAPALWPLIGDGLYRLLFRQPPSGLSDLGEAAITEMVKKHILVDVTHMSKRSLDDTFQIAG
jgi:microsomal dipeptidase-like Zn-dependent dipeptidase